MEIFQDTKCPYQGGLAVEQLPIPLVRAELRLLIALNVKNNLRAEMLLGGIDEDNSIDRIPRIVSSFVRLDLNLS